jgi:hypothetical protein
MNRFKPVVGYRSSQRRLIERLLLAAVPVDPMHSSFIVSGYSDGLLACRKTRYPAHTPAFTGRDLPLD